MTTTNTSTTSGLVNLYSPTHSSLGTSIVGGGGGSLASGLGGGAIASTSQDNTQTYIVHHHHHNSGTNPPGSPDSSNAAPEHYQLGGMGASASLVTTPLDIEWSSTTQYLQKPQQAIMTSSGHQLHHHQQPLNLLSNHIIAATTDNRIHYTVHQTQNRLAVALTGSMNRLSDHRGSAGSPCPYPATSSSYPVNIPLTSPDIGYNYPRQIFSRGLSPPPQYSRAESPPYYPSYGGDAGGGGIMGGMDSLQQQHHNYLSRTSTLPLSLARKPPSGAGGNRTPLVTSPLGTSFMSQQPKSILRTSENFRRVVTNETPPPIPPHNTNSSFPFGGGGSMEHGGSIGSIAYRSVDSRTNLSSQPLLILESSVESSANNDAQVPPPIAAISGGGPDEQEEDEDDGEDSGLHTATLIRRASISAGVSGVNEEEDDERRDQFDIHDIDSDAFSRLLEIDCDSKL